MTLVLRHDSTPVLRQVVEHACGIPTHIMGETVSDVARDMDTYSYRVPLGVTAGICPCVLRACVCAMHGSAGLCVLLLERGGEVVTRR